MTHDQQQRLSTRRMICRGRRLLRITTLVLVTCGVVLNQSSPVASFSVLPSTSRTTAVTRLFAVPEDIQSMKAGAIRKELESYGVSTRSFLEKKELVDALVEARASGKKPKPPKEEKAPEQPNGASKVNGQDQQANGQKDEVKEKAKTKTESTTTEPKTDKSTKSREERLQEEMKIAQGMKVGELREKLTARGISTKSFFEKSEFVKAYATAVVDGVGSEKEEEPFDPTYKDVTMMKMDKAKRQLMGGSVIDINVS